MAKRRANVTVVSKTKVIKRVENSRSKPQLKPRQRNRVRLLRRVGVKRARKARGGPTRMLVMSTSVTRATQSSQAVTK